MMAIAAAAGRGRRGRVADGVGAVGPAGSGMASGRRAAVIAGVKIDADVALRLIPALAPPVGVVCAARGPAVIAVLPWGAAVIGEIAIHVGF